MSRDCGHCVFVALGALLLLGGSLPSSSLAAELESASEKGGWYWNDIRKTPEETEEERSEELPPLPSQEAMMEMHPEEIKKMLEERLAFAVWKLTPSAVTDYYRVQDIARRKAKGFTALTKVALLQTPELNARTQFASTKPGQQAFRQDRRAQIGKSLVALRDRHALGFFTKRGCKYCEVQRAALMRFAEKHQWQVVEIDVDERPDQAVRFDVKVTPFTIVIDRESEKWAPVAVGAVSVPEIEANTYRAVRLMRGEISPEQYYMLESQRGGFFDPGIGN